MAFLRNLRIGTKLALSATLSILLMATIIGVLHVGFADIDRQYDTAGGKVQQERLVTQAMAELRLAPNALRTAMVAQTPPPSPLLAPRPNRRSRRPWPASRTPRRWKAKMLTSRPSQTWWPSWSATDSS